MSSGNSGYRAYPGMGDRRLQSRPYVPLASTGQVAPVYPTIATQPRPAPATDNFEATAQETFRSLDRELAPYEDNKSLIMDRNTYNDLMNRILHLQAHHLWAGYADDLNQIYKWPRNLVKNKIDRCLDPTRATNRDGFYGYLKWASDNQLLPSGTSVDSVMDRFDARNQGASSPSGQQRAPPKERRPKKEAKAPKKRRRPRKHDEDAAYRGR